MFYLNYRGHTIDVTMNTAQETVGEILSALSQHHIEESVELEVILVNKSAYSTYDPTTGKFGDWVAQDGFVEIPNSNQTRYRMVKVKDGVNETSVPARDLGGFVTLRDYKIITLYGDKRIFGEDTTHYYTACGISVSKAKAFLRPQELFLPSAETI